MRNFANERFSKGKGKTLPTGNNLDPDLAGKNMWRRQAKWDCGGGQASFDVVVRGVEVGAEEDASS